MNDVPKNFIRLTESRYRQGNTSRISSKKSLVQDKNPSVSSRKYDKNHRDKNGRTLLHLASRFAPEKVSECVQKYGDVNARDCDGRTALHLLCKSSSSTDSDYGKIRKGSGRSVEIESFCEILAKNGADIDAKDSEGRTALHYAAIDNGQCVSVLLSHDANVNTIDFYGKKPLDYALKFGNVKAIACLVKQFATMENVDAVDGEGKTILHHAAGFANAKAIAKLLNAGVNVNDVDMKGKRALDYAFEKENLDSALVLLACVLAEQGDETPAFQLVSRGNLEMKDSLDRTMVHRSVISHEHNVLNLLLNSKVNVNDLDSFGKSALHYAAESANITAAERLLEAGATVEKKDKDGKTVLHYAARLGHIKLLEMLLKNNKSLNEIDNEGKSALHYAIERYLCNTREVNKLLNAGASADLKDKDGETALHYAKAIAKLLNAGVNVNAVDMKGKRALDYAFEKKNLDSALVLLACVLAEQGDETPAFPLVSRENLEMKDSLDRTMVHRSVISHEHNVLNFLLKSKVNVNDLDYFGKSALHYAAESANITAAERLLEAGASVEEKDKDGKTVLHYAARLGHIKLLEMLLKNNKSLNEIDNEGKSALHYAAESANITAAERLLNAGASAELKDKDGQTALHYAARFGHDKLLDILLMNSKSLNDLDATGKSALDYAVELHKVAAVEKLLRAGARVNRQNLKSPTVLYYFVRRGDIKLFYILLTNKNSSKEIGREDKPALAPAFKRSRFNVGAIAEVKDNQENLHRAKTLHEGSRFLRIAVLSLFFLTLIISIIIAGYYY